MVRRSALNRLQISDETSSMISSILEVAWILLVTFCRFFENINLALTSADAVAAAGGVFRTALIVTSSIEPRSRRLQLQRHISYYTTKSGPRLATRRGESPAGLPAPPSAAAPGLGGSHPHGSLSPPQSPPSSK